MSRSGSMQVMNMNRRPEANYFEHIGNEFLTDDCLSYIEGRIQSATSYWQFLSIAEKPAYDQAIMDGGTYLDIMLHISRVDEFNSLFRHYRNKDSGRSPSLDEYLFNELIKKEIEFLSGHKSKAFRDKHDGYMSCQKMVESIFSDDNFKIYHDYRHEFSSAYLNSFVKNHNNKFSNAIGALMAMSLDNCPRHGYSGLGLASGEGVRQVLHYNVACKLNLIGESDFHDYLDRFDDDDIRRFFLVDFLDGDPKDLSILEYCEGWIDWVNECTASRDMFFGEWMLEMCSLYFAYHLNLARLKLFIDALLDPVFDFFDYSVKDYQCIKDMLYKQALTLEPALFVEQGFGVEDFLCPLKGASKSTERSLNFAKLVYRHSSESNDNWLALPIVCQILKQSGMMISAGDINNSFAPIQFQRVLLSHFKPKGYLDLFMAEIVSGKGSIPSLRKMAQDLLEEVPDYETQLAIQNAYLEELVKRNQDKRLMDKKVGLTWVNRDASIVHLRSKHMLGLYSAVSLFKLSIDDFSQDYDLLSNISKRNLLSNSLEI